MILQENIEEIRKKLESAAIRSKSEVFNDIIIRLLDALRWPINTQVVLPEEFELGTQSHSPFFQQIDTRRDVPTEFVLWHPSAKDAPVYFTLVEDGGIKSAEGQLLENVSQKEKLISILTDGKNEEFSHRKKPRNMLISILTDGKKWHFFYSRAEGDYQKLKVRELNLLKGDSEENAKYLNRYLSYESVCNGEARQAIEEDYRELVTALYLPKAWQNLMKKKDEFLLNAMMKKTKHLYSYTPTAEEVFDFLESLKIDKPSPEPTIITESSIEKKIPTRLSVKMENGEVIRRGCATDTYIDVIEKLGIERILALGSDLLKVHFTLPTGSRGRKYKQSGQYYIRMPGETKTKKESLEKIAKELEVHLEIEIIEKQ